MLNAQDAAIAPIGAMKPTVGKINDSEPPTQRCETARDGAADALCPSGNQGDGLRG